MFIPKPHPNFLQRALHNVSSSRVGAKTFSYIFHHIDHTALKLSRGHFTAGSITTGLPVAVLTTTGAKSGQPRAVPLLMFPDGKKLILIASNWGGKKYPAWYHNLRVHPQCTVTYRGETRSFRAREASPQEYSRYWRQAVQIYKGYDEYKKRTGGRPIPIMVLEPASKK